MSKQKKNVVKNFKKFLRGKNRIMVLVAGLLLVSVIYAISIGGAPETISYNEFLMKVDKQEIKQIKVDLTKGDKMTITTTADQVFETDNPKSESFKLDMLQSGIEVIESDSNWVSNLSTLFSLALTGSLVFIMAKNTGVIGKTKPISERPKIGFNSVAGSEEIKDEMALLVEFLKNPKQFKKHGAVLPKGVILYGDPGTGKTLLAKAMAGEANVPFFSVSGSTFIKLFAGMGALRVRSLFEAARKSAPCIIFIDEIDAVGGKRIEQIGNGEGRQTINALLDEMDGFKPTDGVLVICATNRLEDLDPALIRAGRFDKHIRVPLPQSAEERLAIIELYKEGKQFDSSVDFHAFAKETFGLSPADIKTLLNEAALISIMHKKKAIDRECLDEAVYKKMLKGHAKKDASREQSELELIAWHEAGHSVIAKLHGMDVSKVTITPSTSGVGGVNIIIPKKVGLFSLDEMEAQVKLNYGGRLAELLYLNDPRKVTTGASSDIQKATSIIQEMVTEYGMSSKYGMLNLTQLEVDKNLILDEVSKISTRLNEETLNLLTTHRVFLEMVAKVLLEKETISGVELEQLFNSYQQLI